MKTSLFNEVKKLSIFLFVLSLPSLLFAQWSGPLDISPGAVSAGLNESMGSCIGIGGDSIHVVYCDKKSSTKSVLYYVHSIDTGLTWTAPLPITSPGGNAWNPVIAVNGRNIHIAWREIDTVTGKRASWYIHSTDGGNTWGSKIFLDSTADWPAISVSGSYVYIANDVVTSNSPYNTEIFFMYSSDNGNTWSNRKQLTFALGRSEDEAIMAQGSYIHMSWNDNRSGAFQILYKRSTNFGATWDSDVVVDLQSDYNTMVCSDMPYTDVIATGAPSGKYQVLLAQSGDTGTFWSSNKDLSNDTANTYFLPHMTRDGSNLHVVANSSAGAKYFHSADGGSTWDAPYSLPGATFIAYSGCSLHIIYINSLHIYYIRNPKGNGGSHCASLSSMNDIENNGGVVVSPNPLTTQTTFHLSNTGDCCLLIYDVLGKEVKRIDGTDGMIILQKGTMPEGIYLYRIFQENKLIASGKLAVN